MRDQISERHITCEVCTTSIDVTVLVGDRPRFEIHAVEEVLVDYGWLPTPRGSYCPNHARDIRRVGS